MTRSLRDTVRRVLVIAHREDVSQLRNVLESHGFQVDEVRGPYTEAQAKWSGAARCLVNHANAWKRVVEEGSAAIIVEADFVPVKNFGQLPLPFSSHGLGSGRFGWLYSPGSILYGIDEEGFLHGHGNGTVAYLLDGPAAERCLEFFLSEVSVNPEGRYRPWESNLGVFLRWKCGIRNYFTLYQYGEHGGRSNPEHARDGIRPWHEADVLAAGLSFRPEYARTGRTRLLLRRLRGWLRGALRVTLFRFYNPGHINSDSSRGRLYMGFVALGRILHVLRLPRVKSV